MAKPSYDSQPSATQRRFNTPLTRRILGAAALALALTSAAIGLTQNGGNSRGTAPHRESAKVQQAPKAWTEQQVDQGFTVLGKAPIKSADGKAEIEYAYRNGDPSNIVALVSTTNGSTWDQVTDHVDVANGSNSEQAVLPGIPDSAAWSDKTVDGEELLAVLTSDNKTGTDGIPSDTVRTFAIDGNGVQALGSAQVQGNVGMHYDFPGQMGMKQMYDWQVKNNSADFTLYGPIGGQNPDGTTWYGSSPAAEVTATVPPTQAQ